MELIKPNRITIKGHPVLNEKWVQDRIAEDPSILGLGELDLRDRERQQPRAGRLDLLLYEPETERRYEVEIQLGATDESHIVRTLEYWDIERKRYPQYDHCAVLVAEDVTSRFLNVISLFSGHIPIIALQMNAYEIEGKVALIFTRIVDELRLGMVDEDEGTAEEVDRSYWESWCGQETMSVIDSVLAMVKEIDGGLSLKFNKHYVGLQRGSLPYNFTWFYPRKKGIIVCARMPKSEDVDKIIEDSGIDFLPYNERERCYRVRVLPGDAERQADVLRSTLQRAYAWRSE